VWRSEEEMLEVVRQRAASRRRRNRLVTGAAASCVVAALALAGAALTGGGRPSELRVAGSVEGGGAPRGGPASSPSGEPAGVEEPTTTLAVPPSVPDEPIALQPPSDDLPPATTPTTEARVPGTGTGTSEPGSVPGSDPDTPVSTVVSPTTVPPEGSTGSSPRRVTANPSAVDLRPRPFDSAEVYGSSSVVVRFWGGLPECEPIGRVNVEETATTVTITLYTGRPPGEPQACIAIAVYQELIVELSAPLGSRTIVDGAA
jgi:hypothetical protein